MRLYEVVYILNPALDEAGVNAKLERFHALAISNGGEVAAVDHWGVRQLAYPIKKQRNGYYVVAQFTAASDALPEFERLLRLDDEVMRYLLVLNEGEPTNGQSLVEDVPERAERPTTKRTRRRRKTPTTRTLRRSSPEHAAGAVAWRARRSPS
jgi:small subunit ribosomal protein S6